MADEYMVIGTHTATSASDLQQTLQTAADEKYEWVGTVASKEGEGDLIVMKRKKPTKQGVTSLSAAALKQH